MRAELALPASERWLARIRKVQSRGVLWLRMQCLCCTVGCEEHLCPDLVSGGGERVVRGAKSQLTT